MVSYCSLSNDRLLTKVLIETSNKNSLNGFHQFLNTVDWVDGLDIWSSTQIIKKNDFSRRHLNFHEDIGLYLPKSDQFNSETIPIKNDSTHSKGTNKTNLPERLRQLIKKEENPLEISSSNRSLSLSNEQSSISEDNQTTNIIPKQNSNEISSTKVRFPLRHVQSQNCPGENKSKQNNSAINRDKFQYLLKEQLTNIFQRETSNISSKRNTIRIPSVEIKHQDLPLRTIPQTDPTLILERYSKLQHLLDSSSPNKLFDTKQSPLAFQGISTFGLTVTPLDFSSSKHSSFDLIYEQENSLATIRPSTQPVKSSLSIEQNNEQQKMLLKRNNEKGYISSSRNCLYSTQNSNDDQRQTIKKHFRYHLSSSRRKLRRTKTLEFLPYISGKHIDVNFSNQKKE